MTRLRRLSSGFGARASWTMADQVLSSGTNFAIGLAAARLLDRGGFGTYALVFTVYTVALTGVRAVATQPLIVRFSAADRDKWRAASAASIGVSFAVGWALACICVAVAVLTRGHLAWPLACLGLCLPGLLVQDAWRYVFFAGGLPRQAFVNDLIWALLLVPAVAACVVADHGVAPFFLAWGLTGTAAGLAGLAQAPIVPALDAVTAWWRAHRDLIVRYIGEFVALTGASQVVIFAVGAIAGLAAVGALRAGVLAMGPITILFLGASVFLTPETVRALDRSPAAAWRLCRVSGAALSGTALVWGVVVAVLPARVGSALFGASWTGVQTVIVPLTIATAAGGATAGAVAALRATQAVRRSLRAQCITAPVTVAAGLGGVASGGAFGAACGLAIGAIAGACLWWMEAVREFRGGNRRTAVASMRARTDATLVEIKEAM